MAEPVYGTPAGFAAAAAAADRRRAGTARAAAFALVVALVGAGTTSRVLERAGSTHRLEVATTPDDGAVRPPALWVPPAPVAGARPLGTASPGPAGPGTAVAGPVPAATGLVPRAGEHAATVPDAAPRYRSQSNRIVQKSTTVVPACEFRATDRGCTATEAPMKIGHFWTVVGSYCVDSTGASGRNLFFAEDVEVEFRVTDSRGTLRWSSLPDQPRRAEAHWVTVSKPHCPVWETRWTRRGNDDVALPAGTYTLTMLVRSPDAASAVALPSTFTLP